MFCQFISWANWVNSGKFIDNSWISCQIMADMENLSLTCIGGPRLMRISLMRFFKTFLNYLANAILGLIPSLLRFIKVHFNCYQYFSPWLHCIALISQKLTWKNNSAINCYGNYFCVIKQYSGITWHHLTQFCTVTVCF